MRMRTCEEEERDVERKARKRILLRLSPRSRGIKLGEAGDKSVPIEASGISMGSVSSGFEAYRQTTIVAWC